MNIDEDFYIHLGCKLRFLYSLFFEEKKGGASVHSEIEVLIFFYVFKTIYDITANISNGDLCQILKKIIV